MNPKVFSEGINLITQVFGDAPVKGPRLERIKIICDGNVSDEGFIKICEMMCDTFRQSPLPMDFDKAVKEWQKTYEIRNGKKFNQTILAKIEPTNDCAMCNDLGYVKITHHDPNSTFQTLMRCHCEQGRGGSIGIPEWDYALRSVYKCEPCPTEWFKPDQISEISSDAVILDKLMGKINGWKKILRSAEEYWNDVRKR